jgi:hypothetical protein
MAATIRKGSEYGRPLLQADLVPIDAAAPADVAVIPVPAELAARGYRVTGFLVYNASGAPVLAQLALRNAAAGAGDALVAAAVLTALTGVLEVLSMTVAVGAKQTATSLYARLTVANVAAETVSVKVLYEPL